MRLHHDPTTLDLIGVDSVSRMPDALMHSPNCVVLLSPEGRVLTASTAAVSVLGLDDETQLLGRHWCKMWPSWTHAPLTEAHARALDGRVSIYWANYPNSDGIPSEWDIRISPVFDENGRVSSVLAVSRPVTKH